jgi:hypothetical protein
MPITGPINTPRNGASHMRRAVFCIRQGLFSVKLLNKRTIRFGHIERVKLGWFDPAHILYTDRLWNTRHDIRTEERYPYRFGGSTVAGWVCVFGSYYLVTDRRPDAQFLQQFTLKGFTLSLTGIRFAAGKLPHPTKMRVGEPLRDQNMSVRSDYHRCNNFYRLVCHIV